GRWGASAWVGGPADSPLAMTRRSAIVTGLSADPGWRIAGWVSPTDPSESTRLVGFTRPTGIGSSAEGSPGGRDDAMSQRRLRVGMVGGGGPANFFGAPHRRGILMDNSAELTAGALRSQPAESLASAGALF